VRCLGAGAVAANRRFVQILDHVFALLSDAGRASFCVRIMRSQRRNWLRYDFDALKQYMKQNVFSFSGIRGRHDKVKILFYNRVQLQIIGVGLALKVCRGR